MIAKRCLLAAFLLATVGAEAQTTTLKDSVPHITTTGTASTEVVPDRAELSLGVANERPDADAASQATAKAANDVVADVKARGIEAKDIQTSFALSAQFEDTTGITDRRKLRGYLAYETIRVRLQDVGKASALARALVAKGANSFDGINFTYSRRKDALRELNAAALRDALAEAKSYTDAAGLKLGRILQIGADPASTEGGVADMPVRRMVPNSTAPIPFEPGTQTLSQDVTVIWEIEGKVK